MAGLRSGRARYCEDMNIPPGISSRLSTLASLMSMDDEQCLMTLILDATLEMAYLLGATGSRDELDQLKAVPRFSIVKEHPQGKMAGATPDVLAVAKEFKLPFTSGQVAEALRTGGQMILDTKIVGQILGQQGWPKAPASGNATAVWLPQSQVGHEHGTITTAEAK